MMCSLPRLERKRREVSDMDGRAYERDRGGSEAAWAMPMARSVMAILRASWSLSMAQSKPLDWFSLSYAKPKNATKITYCHGRSFHDGGWFDASEKKPWIEMQRTKDGPWETLGELAGYPATTATNPQELRDGQAFVLSSPGSRDIFWSARGWQACVRRQSPAGILAPAES